MIKIGKKEYLKVPVLKIKQKEVEFYVGKIPANVLLDIFTVEPLVYEKSSYTYSGISIEDMTEDDFLEKLNENKQNSFQRIEDKGRVADIKNYLNDEKNAIFPNTIITSADLKNNFLNSDLKNIESLSGENVNLFNESPGVFLTEDNVIYIPNESSALLVIDGQHRLLGLLNSSNNVKNNFDVLIAFLLGFEKPELAEQFYTINYNQKPVNRSMLEQLKNSFSNDLSEDKVLHEFISIMNENEKSPFYNDIRMLGIGPGMISQAFLKDMLIPYFLRLRNTSKKVPIYRYYYENEEKLNYIINSLIRYFVACQKALDDNDKNWWEAKNTVFTKTIGIGALCKILPNIILKIMDDNGSLQNPDYLNSIKIENYKQVLAKIGKINIEKYQGGGSYGLINVLGDELIELLSLEKYNKDFISENSISWIKSYYF